MKSKSVYKDLGQLKSKIQASLSEIEADLVIKNGKFLDVFSGRFVEGDIALSDGVIIGVLDSYEAKETLDAQGSYIVPGFIDSHVHIESSLMIPACFQQAVLPRGTTSAIWDPHEIANVLGTAGIDWAVACSDQSILDIFVMIPSCVPSTSPELGLETSGAVLTSQDLESYRNHPRVLGLAEMMNFPGLLGGDPDVLGKIQDYKELKRDGHCPGLLGKELNAYAVAGIHSCHESTTLEEAQEKMTKGVHVLIREGSCAKDADTLLPLLNSYNSCVLSFCSDDRNPADIFSEGHMDFIINMALERGKKPEEVFRAASFAPAQIYGLDDRGALAPGYLGDLVLVDRRGDDWKDGIQVKAVYKSGRLVREEDLEKSKSPPLVASGKNMNLDPVKQDDLAISSTGAKVEAQVIGVIPNQILTDHLTEKLDVVDGKVQIDLQQDILKMGVFERHKNTGFRSIGFVKGFGIKKGAIATSINHDCHNVICVGASDDAMCQAINKLIEIDGGIVVFGGETYESLILPVGGLMTSDSPEVVAEKLKLLKAAAQRIGCQLSEPFLQLSFLALPVIPRLKLTDRGLVDVTKFQKIPVCAPL